MAYDRFKWGGGFQPSPPVFTPPWQQPHIPGAGSTGSPSGAAGSDYAQPDYMSLINSDPLYMQLKADLSAQGIADAATRKGSTDRALINFGEVPDFGKAVNGLGLDPNSPMYRTLFGDVDQATRKGATDMTNSGLSTTAVMAKGHATNLENLISSLAARGSIRSGATGVGTGLENQAYTSNQFKARSDLLDYLSGVQQAFTQSERDRQTQLRQGASDAMTRQMGLHPYVPPGSSNGQNDSSAPPTAPPSNDPRWNLQNGGQVQNTNYGFGWGPYVGTL